MPRGSASSIRTRISHSTSTDTPCWEMRLQRMRYRSRHWACWPAVLDCCSSVAHAPESTEDYALKLRIFAIAVLCIVWLSSQATPDLTVTAVVPTVTTDPQTLATTGTLAATIRRAPS